MFVVNANDAFPISADAERLLDRRRFLCAAGAAAVAVVAGEWLAGSPPPSRVPGPVVLRDAASMAVGEARALDTPGGGQAIAVRIDAATVVAFDRRCPHLGCPVVWSAARARFECPCHQAVFDGRTGRVITGPPRQGLTPVPLEVA
jgi:nitrite reductase/ring-hydroxylating ferredoxin subunit